MVKSSRKVAEQFGVSRAQIHIQCFGREQCKTRDLGGAFYDRVGWAIYVTPDKYK